jgi:hypothetical protein
VQQASLRDHSDMGSRFTEFKRFKIPPCQAREGAAHSYIKFALQNSHKNSWARRS